jgi:hypothetical protein
VPFQVQVAALALSGVNKKRKVITSRRIEMENIRDFMPHPPPIEIPTNDILT